MGVATGNPTPERQPERQPLRTRPRTHDVTQTPMVPHGLSHMHMDKASPKALKPKPHLTASDPPTTRHAYDLAGVVAEYAPVVEVVQSGFERGTRTTHTP